MVQKLRILFTLLVFFSIGVTRSRQQDSFYFDPSPLGGEVVEGDQTRLRCDVSNRNHIAFYWTQDDKQVANDSRRFQEDSDLRILRVDRKLDSGSFRCIATNVSTGMSLRSIEARLSILWMDGSAKVLLRNKEDVVPGVDLTVKCQVGGFPEPIVEWYKNKIRLFEDTHIRIHKTRLKVTEVTPEDNGVYSCKAKNLGGEVLSADNYILNIDDGAVAHLDLETFVEHQLVRRGSSAYFPCSYSDAAITEWYDQRQNRLTNATAFSSDTPAQSTPKSVQFLNGTLVLHNVQPSDAGTYRCVGVSASGTTQTFTTQLQLAYLDPLTASHLEPKPPTNGQPKVVPINSKYEVQCMLPEGRPTPTLSWQDPSGAPVPDAGRIRTEELSLLIVNNAQPEDSGNYSCAATNMAADERINVWLVVSEAPEITLPPISDRQEEGQSVRFQCQVTATPYPVTRITWRREDKAIDPTHPRFQVDEVSGALVIKDVHLADDGNYACVVNTTGHPVLTSTYAHLYVKKKLKFRPRPVNTKLELGSTAKIHCRADGQSTPSITWLKDGRPDFPEHTSDIGGTLLFNGVQQSDSGNYTCIAVSEQGEISATISVAVVVKPHFKVRPQNATAYEGYPVMIHCVANGDPKPTIQWDKNSKVNSFDLRRFKVLTNGSLYISEAYMEDIGRYGCTAGNSGGFLREEIFLNVKSAASMRNGNGNVSMRNPDGSLTSVDNFNMMKTIIIAVCSAVAYLAIVIGLTVYCSIRLLKAKQRKANENGTAHIADKTENGTVPTEHTELMDKKERDSSVVKVMMTDDARSHVSGVSSHHSSQSYPASSSMRTRAAYDKLAFPRHDLQTLGMLGKGHYGDVFLAKAHNIRVGESDTAVVVKSLLARDEPQQREFRREMDMFQRANHEHVVRLLGLCRDMEPQFLITEYCEWGDLKQYLWATRADGSTGGGRVGALSVAQQVSMCQQIALAAEHLAHLRIVHGDIAARNVLLTSRLHLKLAHLALCRDVYASDYVPVRQQLVPLRWMAPETIAAAVAGAAPDTSGKGDVWSYACYVYEVFSLGEQPHAELTDEELLRGNVAAVQLDPEEVDEVGDEGESGSPPAALGQLVDRCCSGSPSARPSFSDICVSLSEMTVDSKL